MRFDIILMTVFVAIFLLPSAAFAHTDEADGKDTGQHAYVGELFPFEGKFDVSEEGPFIVSFHAVRLEDGADILSMESNSLDGSYQFAMQFFDGAEHKVSITLIHPETNALIAEKVLNVEVEGFHPPMFIKIKTLAFLMVVIILGMLLGVGMARVKQLIQRLKGGHANGL
jgi:hypothetical protein